MSEPTTYADAFDELQEIISEIESGDVSIDVLSEKVKRATLLIEVCKLKLHATEQDVQVLLEQLDHKWNVPSLRDEVNDEEILKEIPSEPNEDIPLDLEQNTNPQAESDDSPF